MKFDAFGFGGLDFLVVGTRFLNGAAIDDVHFPRGGALRRAAAVHGDVSAPDDYDVSFKHRGIIDGNALFALQQEVDAVAVPLQRPIFVGKSQVRALGTPDPQEHGAVTRVKKA